MDLRREKDVEQLRRVALAQQPATVTINGQAAKVTSTDGGAPFRFDALLNLDAGTSTVVVQAKDGQNNTATKTYSVSATGSSKTFEYDANGNLRYEKQPNGTVTREYRWDQQNRLVRVLEGTHESVYEYDGESHRTRIKELVSSSETKNETFVWCGPRICQKRTSNGTTLVRNYFREGFEEGSSDYFYTRDWLGSVREVVGSDGTTIAARLGYDPWGRCTESGSETADFAFSGQYFDRSVGLNLTLYRAYDPRLARWLSRDPIGLQGGLNLYGYVRNDPLNLADLYGLKPVCERDPNNPDDPYIPQPTPPCPGGYDSCVDVCRTTRHQEKGDCYAGGGTYKMCHEVGDEKFTECKESCEQRCKS